MAAYDDTDRRQHRQVFGWYKDEGMIVDSFTYQTVTASYNGTPCQTIGRALVERAGFEKCKYMTVCIPSYNEDKEELYKTMLSLMQNADFIKKARCSDTPLGLSVEQEFQKTIFILVPIFDGVRAMDDSMKSWLSSNFRGVFDQLLYPPEEQPLPNGKKPDQNPNEVVVKAACRRWWYYTHDVVPTAASLQQQLHQQQQQGSNASTTTGPDGKPIQGQPEGVELFEDHLIQFYMLPIVKKTNHRKHNSHQWFFDSVCLALDETCTYAFLTDCGTTYERNCLAILFKELHVNQHLIGVTARQRVEWPNKYYHPCENSPWAYTKGDHSNSKNKKPCWKCYVSFFFSPCPLQGFEFEASLITNLSIFNLVEALPVMPGPCQLMNWQKMKHFQIVKEYFNLLFKSEVNKKEKINVPPRYHKMIDDSHDEDSIFSGSSRSNSDDESDNSAHGLLHRPAGNTTSTSAWDEESKVSRSSRRSLSRHQNKASEYGIELGQYASVPGQVDEYDIPMLSNNDGTSASISPSVSPPKPIPTPISQTQGHGGAGGAEQKLTFTEFLRTNMRLAEDRVLSFVGVFSTRYGTKWIPGATFYYTPEITWQTLLLQRRRWINGTLAAYFFFLLSRRAKTRLNARMFDDHNAAKVMVLFLWRMQLFQLLLVFIAPAVFGSTAYISILDCAKRFPNQFGWAAEAWIGDSITGAQIFIIFAYLIYAAWVVASYFIQNGRMPEYVCQILALLGFFFMIPVYWSLYSAIFMIGIGFVAILVFLSLFAPAIISLAESAKCLQLYLCYFPWFMTLIVFFLIFMPSYSFSRLFDTTWGNRATGSDSAVQRHEEITMKRWNLFFIIFLMITNFMITVLLQRAYNAGYNVVMTIMILVFIPSVVQLIGAILFWMKTFVGRYCQRGTVMSDIIQARAQLRAMTGIGGEGGAVLSQPPGSTPSSDLSNGGKGMFAHGLDMGVSMYIQNPLRGPSPSTAGAAGTPTAPNTAVPSSGASVASHHSYQSHRSHHSIAALSDVESGPRSMAASQRSSFRRVPSNPALAQNQQHQQQQHASSQSFPSNMMLPESQPLPPQPAPMWVPPPSPRAAAANQEMGMNYGANAGNGNGPAGGYLYSGSMSSNNSVSSHSSRMSHPNVLPPNMPMTIGIASNGSNSSATTAEDTNAFINHHKQRLLLSGGLPATGSGGSSPATSQRLSLKMSANGLIPPNTANNGSSSSPTNPGSPANSSFRTNGVLVGNASSSPSVGRSNFPHPHHPAQQHPGQVNGHMHGQSVPSPRHLFAASSAPIVATATATPVLGTLSSESNVSVTSAMSALTAATGMSASNGANGRNGNLGSGTVSNSFRSTLGLPSPRSLNNASNSHSQSKLMNNIVPQQAQSTSNAINHEGELPGAFYSGSSASYPTRIDAKVIASYENLNNISGSGKEASQEIVSPPTTTNKSTPAVTAVATPVFPRATSLQTTPSMASIVSDASGLAGESIAGSSTIHISREYSPTTIHSGDNPMIVVEAFPHHSHSQSLSRSDSSEYRLEESEEDDMYRSHHGNNTGSRKFVRSSSGISTVTASTTANSAHMLPNVNNNNNNNNGGNGSRNGGIAETTSFYSMTDEMSVLSSSVAPNIGGGVGGDNNSDMSDIGSIGGVDRPSSNRYPFNIQQQVDANNSDHGSVRSNQQNLRRIISLHKSPKHSDNDNSDDNGSNNNNDPHSRMISRYAINALQSAEDDREDDFDDESEVDEEEEDVVMERRSYSRSQSQSKSRPVTPVGLSSLLPRSFNNGIPLAVTIPDPPNLLLEQQMQYQQQQALYQYQQQMQYMDNQLDDGYPMNHASSTNDAIRRGEVAAANAEIMDDRNVDPASITVHEKIQLFQRMGMHASSADDVFPSTASNGHRSTSRSPGPSRAASLDYGITTNTNINVRRERSGSHGNSTKSPHHYQNNH